MQRRHFLQASALTGFTLLNSKNLLAQWLEDPYKMKDLRGNVGVFTEKGGTIAYYLDKEGIVVVDSQFPEQSEHLIAALRKTSEQPFKYLINTHHHGDHTSGNIAYKGLVGQVVAHVNSDKNQRAVAEKGNSVDKQLFPDMTFGNEGWQQKIGKERIRTHYFGAGHTDGDSIIHFENANVAHMGDLLFNGRYPFIDKSAGASIGNWIKVLDKTDKTFDENTLFVFSHAFDPEKITGGKEEIKQFKGYLESVLAYVGKEIKAEKSKEEIMKATSIPGVTYMQGDGIQRSLGPAYDELTA